MYRTTSHPTETLTGRKPRRIHNAFLPKDLTFPNSCAKKILTTGTAIYVRDHRQYEVDVDGQIGSKSSKLETGPLDIVLGAFDLPPLGNNETPEIQPLKSTKNSLRTFQETLYNNPGGFNILGYDGKLSPESAG
ncbi:hypothetical protein ACTXT7_007000 [Hymenolepis weldensis]